MADMAQVQEQSRKSFFQWHLLLSLKKKELQKTLNAAGLRPELINQIEAEQAPVVDSEELELLLRLALPIPDDLSPYDLPERDTVAGVRFFFRAALAFDNEDDVVLDLIRQDVDGTYERAELMRVSYANRDYLQKGAEKFNQALSAYSTHMVFNAAKVWSSFHQAVVMPWQAISARLLGVGISENSDDWYTQLSDPGAGQTQQKKPRIDLSGRTNLFGDT
ncbi:MAG: hypothetical protein WBC91_02315 [Phototrophicaceae bacterium]